MRFVVLAAGGGKRMGPLTTQTPKVLLPVANRPLMGWTLEGLKRAGADRATLVLNHAEAEMRKFLREQSPIPTKMVRQPRRDGTARGAQAGAGKRPKDPIFLLYGDVFLPEATLTKLAKEPGSWIGTYNVEDASPYGSVETRAGRLVRIHEKTSKPPSRRIFAGVARLEPDVLARLASLKKSARGEYELTDALNQHAGEGGKIRVLDLPEWYEAGRPWHLLGIQERLLRDASGKGERTGAIIEPGARLIGHVEVGAGTRIRSGAYIEGPVVIGREAKIGPNCYLRPTTSIGDHCHIGASVEVKNSIIMHHTNIPHLSYIGDSVIANDVNLGAGTNVANLKVTPIDVRVTWEDGSRIDTGLRKFGVVIGPDTKIGINASLNPGTIVGANCLVGAGRVVSGWVPSGTRLL